VFEDVLQKNLLVYVQLPSNLFKIQAPALGKVVLMDLQQEASLRQVFRDQRNQRPFSVNIDEFGTFADRSFIDSLNKLRDANILFTLSHQTLADLEIVSKEFAQAVWENCRTRDVLALDSPELCERLARSLGTRPRLEHTIQQGPGAMSTVAATGVMSTRAVESLRLHPNRLKMLASRGQGFLFASRPDGQVAIPSRTVGYRTCRCRRKRPWGATTRTARGGFGSTRRSARHRPPRLDQARGRARERDNLGIHRTRWLGRPKTRQRSSSRVDRR
jgi:hypothetical protein